jgi:hypothetical protein
VLAEGLGVIFYAFFFSTKTDISAKTSKTTLNLTFTQIFQKHQFFRKMS